MTYASRCGKSVVGERKRFLLARLAPLVLTLLMAGPSVAAENPSRVGRWEAPRRWPVPGIHSILLPGGEVLNYSYADFFAERPGSRGVIWNPVRDKFRDPFALADNFFCSGHSVLVDGRVFVSGGWVQGFDCTIEGPSETVLLDPASGEWSPGPPMRRGRYYPSLVTLGDGRVLIFGGDDASCNRNLVVEIFDPADDSLSKVTGLERAVDLYPRAHLLSDGRIGHVGPEDRTFLLDPEAGTWTPITRTRRRQPRFEGTSFLVPGSVDEVMTCGGFGSKENRGAAATCERIDFSKRAPSWREARPMHFERAHANAVLLPDGTVLVVGGGAADLYQGPVKRAEIYDPQTDSWTLAPAQRYGRMYHSTALLLADGRVLSTGQDEDPTGRTGSAAWAEFYQPPYLFRGSRPQIRRAPRKASYGESVIVKAKPARRVERAVFLRPGAVTHSVDMEQRYLEVEVTYLGGAKLEISLPRNPNLAPPGHYLLFLVNEKGAVSEGRFVRIEAPGERG